MVTECTPKEGTDNARNTEYRAEQAHVLSSVLQGNDLGHQSEHGDE
jgi:hypothetical protein